MVFSTYVFLFCFAPLTLGVYYALPFRYRNGWLALVSYLFYGWWRPEYCVLLALMTVFNYFCGGRIVAGASDRQRHRWVVISVIGSLGLLGYFKYVGMMTIWVDSLSQLLTGARSPIGIIDVVLPIGISFYTFQALSYTIDIYRREAQPAKSLVSFAAYIAMFPQLIAGPIVRYEWIADELRSRTHTLAKVLLGVRFFGLGLGKKLILADSAALITPIAFENIDPTFLEAWLGVLGYTVQVYFDFSGYSDMAVGLGLMFGFRFPQNFNSPYKSASITEFWRRWHLSLSSWLKDYLYIPLGGNRRGVGRTYLNLMIVMLLGGLWHGASIQFVVWGGWHGFLLAIERALGDRHPLKILPRPLAILGTNLLVILSLVPFRATSWESCGTVLVAMFSPISSWSLARLDPVAMDLPFGASLSLISFAWIILAVGLGICWFCKNSWEYLASSRPHQYVFEIFVALWALLAVLTYESSPFLYFQF